MPAVIAAAGMKKAVNASDRKSGLLPKSKRGQFGKLDQQAIVSGADSTADDEQAEAQSVITQVDLLLLGTLRALLLREAILVHGSTSSGC